MPNPQPDAREVARARKVVEAFGNQHASPDWRGYLLALVARFGAKRYTEGMRRAAAIGYRMVLELGDTTRAAEILRDAILAEIGERDV